MTTQRIVRIALVLFVLAAGGGVKVYLDATRPAPGQKTVVERGELVEVQPVLPKDHAIHVEAQGRIVPARELSLAAEVSGRVRWINDQLVQGGRVEKGTTLLRIDPRDYQLAAAAQAASVDRSTLELQVEKSRGVVAKREVKLLGGGTAGELARRAPQLRTAENALRASESALERANLLIAKTVIRVPFNAIVLSESTEVGQLVGPGAPLARLAGTDHFWVEVSVPVAKLGWIAIPGVNAKDGQGASAAITQDVGGETISRTGRVLRLAGDLDPAGQMARLIVEVDDPLGIERREALKSIDLGDEPPSASESALPLLLGAFVDVKLDAGTLDQVAEVPRSALRDGGRVFLIDANNQLESRKIRLAWRETEKVYVKDDLKPGERLITSRLPTAIPGMKLRVAGEAKKKPAGGAGAKVPKHIGDAPAEAATPDSTTVDGKAS